MAFSFHPRLGLSRRQGDALWELASSAGWDPIPTFLTAVVSMDLPIPVADPDAVLLLSPSGARHARLPLRVPILATGPGTAQELHGRDVWIPSEPSAEGLWSLLQKRFPEGGDFLLVRAEQSRGFLESVSKDTPWRIHPWMTHAERALEPVPDLPELEAVLALSPLQAELMGPRSARHTRIAWGERTARAFKASGFPPHAVCEPTSEALLDLLKALHS